MMADGKSNQQTRDVEVSIASVTKGPINASGHHQELERNFSLLSICGIAISTGESWIALGGSIVCSFNILRGWKSNR
jgi:choline transport protein